MPLFHKAPTESKWPSPESLGRPWERDYNGPTLERVLLGQHERRVKVLAVTPDGSRVVSGSEDHTVGVWNLGTGGLERTLEGHTSWVTAVAVNPDGARIASGASAGDPVVRVWNLATGGLERTLEGHTSGVDAVAFTPDGSRLISGGDLYDKTIRIWDLATGSLERTLTCYSAVKSVAVSPDGKWMVSGGGEGNYATLLWDLERGVVDHVIHTNTNAGEGAAFGPDGRWIAYCSTWVEIVGRERDSVWGQVGGQVLEAMALTADGLRIVAAGGKRAWVWDLQRNRVRFVDDETDYLEAVAVTRDGRRMFTAGREGKVRVLAL